jgi:crotonobetainyl-CoA:carnitine CoA-transferase CaiB-like acyl-CoA transferase
VEARSARPLSGVRILDLTRFLAGPYCTMLLADLGAEVIKIEPPEGDESRHQKAYRYGDETAYYISANRNKRGIVLDLKRPEGRQVFYELVAHADVVVDNYRAQTLRRLGADYERLRQIKPDIICCSLTAFGDEGTAAARPGYDLVIQAMGGGMSLTGEPGRPPVRMGLPIGDVAGGMFAAHGILAALYERTRSGQGQRVSTTLLSAQIALHTYVAAYYWQSGQEPGPVGSAHASMVPYQAFRTRDGWIAVVAHTPKFYANFCTALGRPDLISHPHFADLTTRLEHRAALLAIIDPIMASRSTAEWTERLVAADVPCGPVHSVGQALADPLILAQNMVVEVEHSAGFGVRVAGNPIKFSRTPAEQFASPPRLGEHTAQVLQELLGYDAARIRQLAGTGALGPSPIPAFEEE